MVPCQAAPLRSCRAQCPGSLWSPRARHATTSSSRASVTSSLEFLLQAGLCCSLQSPTTMTRTILPATRHLSSLPVSRCAQKASPFLLPIATVLRSAFVPRSSTVAGEQTTLLPFTKSWTKPLLCRRIAAPLRHYSPSVSGLRAVKLCYAGKPSLELDVVAEPRQPAPDTSSKPQLIAAGCSGPAASRSLPEHAIAALPRQGRIFNPTDAIHDIGP
jgi:hypothetical protein